MRKHDQEIRQEKMRYMTVCAKLTFWRMKLKRRDNSTPDLSFGAILQTCRKAENNKAVPKGRVDKKLWHRALMNNAWSERNYNPVD
jgi:hypothetical protein